MRGGLAVVDGRGGEDRRAAFITLSGTGRLAAMRWPRPGLALAG